MKLILIFSLIILTSIIGCTKKDSTNPVTPVIQHPIAAFGFTGALVTPATVSFNNSSTNANSYRWDFGDGRTSIQENPSMLFNNRGTLTVTLIAINTSSSLTDTTRHTLSITPGRVYLDSLVINDLPWVDGTGAGWDLTSGPDVNIYFGPLPVSETSGSFLYSWGTLTDLTQSQLPISAYISTPWQFANWSTSYGFAFYDYDAGSSNDLMGTVSFTINNLITQGYLNSYNLQTGSYRLKLVVHWQ